MQPMADLSAPGNCQRYKNGNCWWIHRVNVPQAIRGKGYGTQLLEMILADADRDRVWLGLEAYSSGDLTQQELEDWYLRHGFVKDPWDQFFRAPR